jgi:hypothetical protein
VWNIPVGQLFKRLKKLICLLLESAMIALFILLTSQLFSSLKPKAETSSLKTTTTFVLMLSCVTNQEQQNRQPMRRRQ